MLSRHSRGQQFARINLVVLRWVAFAALWIELHLNTGPLQLQCHPRKRLPTFENPSASTLVSMVDQLEASCREKACDAPERATT